MISTTLSPLPHHDHTSFHQQNPHIYHCPHTHPHCHRDRHHLSMKAHSEEGLGSERFWWVRTAHVVTMHNGRPVIDSWSYHFLWRWWSWAMFPTNHSQEGPLDNDENESVGLARSADFIFKRTWIRISKQTSLDVTTSNISSLFQVSKSEHDKYYSFCFKSDNNFLLFLENDPAPPQPIGQICIFRVWLITLWKYLNDKR